jgi:aminotransferase
MSFEIKVNPYIANIPYGDRKKMLAAAEGKENLVDLMSGNPDMEMPHYIREQVKKKIDTLPMRYTPYYGIPELKERLSDIVGTEWGTSIDPEQELLITHGVQEGLYAAMRTILHSGDEVLVPTPHYANYPMDTVACGAEPIFVPLKEDEGFVPNMAVLKQYVTSKTRALVFANPNNPLGITWPDDTIRNLAEFAKKHNLIVLVDEIYREFAVPKPPLSIASLPGMRERTFTFRGFSKSYFMMGMRIGYLVGPPEVMHHIKQLHYLLLLSPSTVGQWAALAALDCPEDQLAPLRQEFRDKVAYLYKGISEIQGITCEKPNGTFFIFPNVTCFGMKSLDVALELIKEEGLKVLPGTEFGEAGEGYLRLSVTAKWDQVKEGLERFIRFAAKHNR